VGTRTTLDAVVKRKIPSPRRESNPRIPIVQPVAQRYTLRAITSLSLSLSIYIYILWLFALRRIVERKIQEVRETGENYIIRSFVIFTNYQMLQRCPYQDDETGA
jgi:hypothetical protein